MKKQLYISILSLFSLFISCEYNLHDEYHRDIDSNIDPPNIEVDLNFQSDTVYIKEPSIIRFKFTTTNQQVKWVTFYIDDVMLGQVNSNSGLFELSPTYNNYEEGVHDMKIEAFTNSGTGSIGDAVGAEGFLFSYTWILVIDENRNLSSNITNVRLSNGSIIVEWEAYKGIDFKEYVLLKSLYGGEYDTVSRTDDQNTTFTFDSSYVGEPARYKLKTVLKGDYYSLVDEHNYVDIDKIPQLTLQNLNDSSVVLKWSKSKYYNNIAGYKLSYRDTRYSSFQEIAVLQQDDLTFVFQKKSFAVEYEFKLTLIPKDPPVYFFDQWYVSYYSTSCKGYIGELFSLYDLLQIPSGQLFYYTYYGKIYQYNYLQKTIADSIVFDPDYYPYDYSVSPDGRYLTAGISNNTCLFYDLANKEKNYISSETIANKSISFYRQSVSNSGVAVLSSDYDIYVYNYVTEQLITSFTYPYVVLNLIVSPDSKYFFVNSGSAFLYKIEGNNVVKLWDQTESNINLDYYCFNPDNPEELFMFDYKSKTLHIKDISTMQTIRSFQLPSDQILNIDFNSHKIFASTQNELQIFNLSNGEMIWEYPTNTDGYFQQGSLSFCYDAIYLNTGYKLNIDW